MTTCRLGRRTTCSRLLAGSFPCCRWRRKRRLREKMPTCGRVLAKEFLCCDRKDDYLQARKKDYL
jgi:hypothetical protein